MKKWISYIIISLMVSGIVWIFYMLDSDSLTTNESTLLSLLLTILSIGASWIISSIYSETSHNQNIKNFALKAAEKVNNLSNELSRLSYYLQEELENSDDTKSIEETLIIRDAKIESVIHIISTLKSMNDTSLSDWQGVIGEEIEQQKLLQRQKEDELIEVLDKINVIQESIDKGNKTNGNDSNMENKLDEFAKELRILTSQVTGTIPKRKRNYENKVINCFCPVCNGLIGINSSRLKKKMGAIKCNTCENNLYFTFDKGNIDIRRRVPINEEVICPKCNKVHTIPLDPFPGNVHKFRCEECNIALRVTRNKNGLSVLIDAYDGKEISDEISELVYKNMPMQPWPKGASAELAKKFSLNHSEVNRAIQKLIQQGKFKSQIDGELFNLVRIEK